ncbi:hypothetical protein DTO013E5_9226 [Penicillium roqueforti]|uniref:Genomic scaffold, ProqFM164S04 n=1 Tax=Penicillium roqueforti (strain FM164) TaxID=1365484 RepID=W6R1V3_PENRF|nr:uncharacterized protein LCP9604111_8952 [Penicillium roqueforti]CDM35792.1 unnamed protein product [Penicillium roqueforti FM164]KAF9239932.1 hypothetical protein LCP9604111_8952 [Penicillium roqueforti]KAI1831406.1 hypothetical protein CBS147337_7872 [Penicillium roqueforti]KAI2671386.1 hypothetical protein CBS147355_8668 [Penicillium roqueforti]KAI2672896.1 hypothetical protein LCP963914a_9226 [Penicillium roqueforti]
MQPKSLAALLLASMAMAAPADTNSAIESGDAGLADIIPPSIAVVLATAVPSSFWAEATNTAAFLSQVEQGIVSNSWPTWYSSLPDSVKAYVTTAVEGYYPSFASSVSAEITSSGASSSGPSTAEATSTGASSSGASSSGAASSGASRSAASSSAASSSAAAASSSTDSTSTTTVSSSSSAATGSDAASSSAAASASASGSASSTTADGGAAPTGVAMSLAGAVGVLGLALAL